jgi:hypothetical protein
MTVIEWDKSGERVYQSGVDRGVLYLKDGTVVPWNGLTSVEDGTSSEVKAYYLDGIKILEHATPGEYSGKLSAFTYPDEFEEVLGNKAIAPGVLFYEQKPKSFNLAYRTRIANDIDPELGYKLHLLYNLHASAESHTYESLSNDPQAPEFGWSLSGTPPIGTIDGIRPTVHVSLDSRETREDLLQVVENILYGTATSDPRFPTILELRLIFGEVGGLYIIDNGDGTWTAIDPSDDFINMLDADTFEIQHADAEFTDPPLDTEYTITDTSLPLP